MNAVSELYGVAFSYGWDDWDDPVDLCLTALVDYDDDGQFSDPMWASEAEAIYNTALGRLYKGDPDFRNAVRCNEQKRERNTGFRTALPLYNGFAGLTFWEFCEKLSVETADLREEPARA